jgi:ribosomal protein L37AE/L43A
MSVRDAYKDAKCPDCGWPIPLRAANGHPCSNCGHALFSEAYTRKVMAAHALTLRTAKDRPSR